MAKDIRQLYTERSLMTTQTQAIIQECKNQAESCLYTSTGLYMRLDDLKWTNRIWNALPIILGGFASFAFFQQSWPFVAAFCALLAGMLPAIHDKLKIQAHTEEILTQAGRYKILEHRFRQAADIIALDENPEVLKAEFDRLIRQMDDLRSQPVILPEKYFLAGRDKIKAGHYDFDSVEKSEKQ